MKDTFDWSKDREAEATKLYGDGHTAAQIAGLFNQKYRARLTRAALAGKLNRLGARPGGRRKASGPVPGRLPEKPRRAGAGMTVNQAKGTGWSRAALDTLKKAWMNGEAVAEIVETYNGQLDGGRKLNAEIFGKLRARHDWPARHNGARPKVRRQRKPRPKASAKPSAALPIPDYGVRRSETPPPQYSRHGKLLRGDLTLTYAPQVPRSSGVSIMALTLGMCRLILGYEGDEAIYCGCRCEPKTSGGFNGFDSYCPGHRSAMREKVAAMPAPYTAAEKAELNRRNPAMWRAA